MMRDVPSSHGVSAHGSSATDRRTARPGLKHLEGMAAQLSPGLQTRRRTLAERERQNSTSS